ncbi:hypothetical protein NP233_g12049 [Leucocoprinus birnbaumii]|uniref:Uncharacterized protein n=1 Tax=Leucocoprinus birnbaumii TaxID=56174 RepID=A0AAD5VF42_9AGAR|nr:hypothetical protein NP233_g12049 [Leucocoprinus birnbaumii]
MSSNTFSDNLFTSAPTSRKPSLVFRARDGTRTETLPAVGAATAMGKSPKEILRVRRATVSGKKGHDEPELSPLLSGLLDPMIIKTPARIHLTNSKESLSPTRPNTPTPIDDDFEDSGSPTPTRALGDCSNSYTSTVHPCPLPPLCGWPGSPGGSGPPSPHGSGGLPRKRSADFKPVELRRRGAVFDLTSEREIALVRKQEREWVTPVRPQGPTPPVPPPIHPRREDNSEEDNKENIPPVRIGDNVAINPSSVASEMTNLLSITMSQGLHVSTEALGTEEDIAVDSDGSDNGYTSDIDEEDTEASPGPPKKKVRQF